MLSVTECPNEITYFLRRGEHTRYGEIAEFVIDGVFGGAAGHNSTFLSNFRSSKSGPALTIGLFLPPMTIALCQILASLEDDHFPTASAVRGDIVDGR